MSIDVKKVDYSKYRTNMNDAKEVGDKHYFPNKPCFRGHVGLRYTNGNSGCVVCDRLRKSGQELPPLRKVYGVGFNSAIREGIPVFENGKISKCYDAWRRMLQRCYDEKYKQDHPTYVGIHCCEEWKDFQYFAKWWYTQPNRNLKYELDKDLLVEGNKIYSPETCTLLPTKINKTITVKGYVSNWSERDEMFRFSALKTVLGYDDHWLKYAEEYVDLRNNRIKNLAEEYKDTLTDTAYIALKNFRIMYSLDGAMYRGFY